MKIAAWLILLGVFGLPFVLSLWLIFPVVAGIAAVVLVAAVWFQRGPAWLRPVLTPVLGVLLAVFVIWLFLTPVRPEPGSVADSSVAKVLLTVPAPQADPAGDELVELRRALTREIGVTRFKIQKVAGAIDTLRSAESVFMTRSVDRQSIDAELGAAIEDVTVTLGQIHPDGQAGTLLDRPVLTSVVVSLEDAVAAIEQGADAAGLTRDELIARQDQLPGLLNRAGVNLLPTRLVRLENAVQQTLGARLDSATRFHARYDRSADAIAYEQETTLRFNGSQPRQLDLANLFPGTADPDEIVSYRVNGGVWVPVDRADPRPPLALDASTVVVRRVTSRSGVSRRILNGRYFLSFKAIDVHWPTSTFPSIVTLIRLPENPDRTWPWTVDTGVDASFLGVEIPRHSFIYSTPPGTVADQTDASLVTFAGPLTPQSLATNTSLAIELLPRWLSLGPVQRNKDLLVVENLIAALAMFTLAAAATAFVELTAPAGKTTPRNRA